MKIESVPVYAEKIHDLPGLDPIEVFWCDYRVGAGSVTITCWGNAWTCYFGAMGDDTIKRFFKRADEEYLSTKLGINQVLKSNKRNTDYLRKIIRAIKGSIV